MQITSIACMEEKIHELRLAAHADRRGVAPEIERALDRAIAADVSDGPAQR